MKAFRRAPNPSSERSALDEILRDRPSEGFLLKSSGRELGPGPHLVGITAYNRNVALGAALPGGAQPDAGELELGDRAGGGRGER